ncbi:MAG: hypothetical protein GXP53_02835 [Deltaproteobacteria bacterium]|nr:hypothetical protein [Deltaproteobacteria bacterium]
MFFWEYIPKYEKLHHYKSESGSHPVAAAPGKALVRILLRNGISFQVFADLARWVYTDVAFREFAIEGKKQTLSRVSVLTGLSRKEVQRQRRIEAPVDDETAQRYNRATRVVSAWVRDHRFVDSQGNPLPLSMSGPEPSFATLVHLFSGDMPVRAVLDEMLRVGAVALNEDETLRLATRAYLPGSDKEAKINILGVDVADLVTTIDHNLVKSHSPFFQRKVSYDNVPAEVLEKFNVLCTAESQALLEKLDEWLAARDRDTNPEIHGLGRKRVGLGIYYFEEDLEGSLPL